MLKTRIILIVASLVVIWLIFLLPKVVVENESALKADTATSSKQGNTAQMPATEAHTKVPPKTLAAIHRLRSHYQAGARNEKNAIFADSLINLYADAGKFDSAAWFAEEAASFFNTVGSWMKAGENYYQAYTFALDQSKQARMAEKSQTFFTKVLEKEPRNFDAKTKMAMTYFTSSTPMKGVMMLREVLKDDPKNELALFNLGMLSIQSGQYDKAVDRLKELIEINPAHTQGQLLLGIALMKTGKEKAAKEQFLKVKDMDKDPSVQAAVDSYLQDLK